MGFSQSSADLTCQFGVGLQIQGTQTIGLAPKPGPPKFCSGISTGFLVNLSYFPPGSLSGLGGMCSNVILGKRVKMN